MATEVLHPQDVLVERFRVPPTSFPRRKNFPGNGNVTTLAVNRRQHRKGSPKPDKKIFNAVAAAEAKRSSHGGGLVMGQVTLLKRGEPLGSIASKIADGNPRETIRNPAIIKSVSPPVLKQIRLVAAPSADIYAGSAFFMSPSPRSVPLPSFFSKKDPNNCESELFEDGATRDLRRMLRLE